MRPTVKVDLPAFADDIGQRVEWQELRNRQSSHRENQFGSKKFKLAPQPIGALLYFGIARNSIAATRIFPREAAADRRKINPAAHGFFVPAECGLKPMEEGLARCPGKRATEDWFLIAGSLSDKEDLAGHRASNHDRSVHAWAPAAVRQLFKVRS